MRKDRIRVSVRAFVSIAAAVVMMAAFGISVGAETVPKEELADSYAGKTVVIQTNDVHGAIEGYRYVKGLKTQLEGKGAHVVLVDCGDFSQGSIYVADSQGASAVDLMNDCGYAYISLGNHEFDYGTQKLLENVNVQDKSFTTLCANLTSDSTGQPAFTPSAVYTVPGTAQTGGAGGDGLKIGFYGVLTEETLTSSMPGNIQGMSFMDPQATCTAVSKEIDTLEAGGADVIIGLTHLGINPGESPLVSTDLYAETKSAIGTGGSSMTDDAIKKRYMLLDSHSHSIMTEGSGGEPIMSTGTKLMNVGIVVIDEASEKIEKNFLYQLRKEDKDSAAFKENLASDETVASKAAGYKTQVDNAYETVIGRSEVVLNGKKSAADTGTGIRGNRDGETNLGDLITDAFRWYVTEKLGADTGSPAVSVINGGGVRASIDTGDISRQEVYNVMPFGNTVCIVNLKGSDLLEALEASSYCTPEVCGGFPQVSGIEMELNERAEYIPLTEPYPDSMYYGPKKINRVTIKSINGQPFDSKSEYAVVTNSFCAKGGDTYRAFANSEHVVDTGITDEYILECYIQEKLGGVVGTEYAEPQGRIKISDVKPDKAKKAAQPMKVKAAGKTLKQYTRKNILSRRAVKLRAIRVRNAKGKVRYKKISGSKRLSVDRTSGKITVKKGLKKGSYKLTVAVKAAGDLNYSAGTKKVTVTINVR